ncbi:Crp/Fnr family transcriptional regulator [candidate division KSB1 bacterium]|nr:Crp/Fnr family transcriptional regulator [candidate division KSB1 bacterium]
MKTLISDFKTIFFSSVSTKGRNYRLNELIFRQGDPAHYIFVIEEGRVKLERYTIEGRRVVMHTAKAGESLAEAALFSEVYHCNAIATLPSQLLLFPKQEVLQRLSGTPQMTMKYLSLLSSQVRNLRTRLELTNILSARERILQFILLSVNPDTGETTLNGALKDLAAEIGLAHETFYRELKKLEKEGIIERSDNRIKIKSIPSNMIEII